MFVFAAISVVVVMVYTRYNKPHRDVTEEPFISANAIDLFKQYQQNEQKANAMFLDKVLLVSGTIADIQTNQDGKQVIIFKTNDPLYGVSCTLSNPTQVPPVGNTIELKGFCRGYLSDVVLTDCVKVKSKEAGV